MNFFHREGHHTTTGEAIQGRHKYYPLHKRLYFALVNEKEVKAQ